MMKIDAALLDSVGVDASDEESLSMTTSEACDILDAEYSSDTVPDVGAEVEAGTERSRAIR